MRKSSKLLVATAAAALVATGGSAFTAANTGVDDAFVGFDSAAVSGVTVTNVEYVVSTTDASELSSIVFTENQNVSTGHEAILTINGTTTAQITCSPTWNNNNTTADATDDFGVITCLTPGQTVAGVTSISLTVATI